MTTDWRQWDGRNATGPLDYDGGPVLLRCGKVGVAGYWIHHPDYPHNDIVGYRGVAWLARLARYFRQPATKTDVVLAFGVIPTTLVLSAVILRLI